MSAVSFNFCDVSFNLKHRRILKRWLLGIAKKEQKKINRVHVNFCSDVYLLHINKQYLQKEYYTDIITFDYTKNNQIEGEMFISLDTVRHNAYSLNIPIHEELYRVMAHGILHMCGFNDATNRQQQIMRRKEEESLKILKKMMTKRT